MFAGSCLLGTDQARGGGGGGGYGWVRCWCKVWPASLMLEHCATLVQPLMFATKICMLWAGDGALFSYTGRTTTQCFLCFLMNII